MNKIKLFLGILIFPFFVNADIIEGPFELKKNLEDFSFAFQINRHGSFETNPVVNLSLNYPGYSNHYKFNSCAIEQRNNSKLMKLTFFNVRGNYKFDNLIIFCKKVPINPNYTEIDAFGAKFFYSSNKENP
jgi:hypothetical protein